MLRPVRGERLAWLLAGLTGRLFRTLGKLGLQDKVAALVDALSDQMLEGRALAELQAERAVNWPVLLRAC